MRRGLVLGIVLLGCRPGGSPAAEAGRELAVEGLKVSVEPGLVPLEADRVRKLRESYERQEPDADATIIAVRGKTLMDATVSLSRGVRRSALTGRYRTVRDALDAAVQGTSDAFRQGGAQLKDVKTSVRNGGFESCVVAVLPAPQLPPTYLCSLYYVDADARLLTLSTTCVARDTALCERVIASRTYAVEGALELGKSLAVAPPPPGR